MLRLIHLLSCSGINCPHRTVTLCLSLYHFVVIIGITSAITAIPSSTRTNPHVNAPQKTPTNPVYSAAAPIPLDFYSYTHRNTQGHSLYGALPIRSEHPETVRCEPITLSLCKGMYYTETRMPNMFHHETQQEAGLEAHQFYPLVQINCSEDLRFFLCSIYTPICIKGFPTSLPPCRSICKRVKAGCAPVMEHYNIPWPERMNCAQFPVYQNPEGVLCMERNLTADDESSSLKTQTHQSVSNFLPATTSLSTTHGPVEQVSALETRDQDTTGIDDKWTASEKEASVLFMQLARENQSLAHALALHSGVHLECSCSCRYPLIRTARKTDISTNERDTMSQCELPCRLPFVTSTKKFGTTSWNESVNATTNANFTNFWLALWSLLCIMSTSMTIATFMMDRTRFRYPEMPIVYVCVCYLLVAIGYLIRVLQGHEAIACDSDQSGSNMEVMSRLKVLRYSMTGRAGCAIVFLFTYFFGMAAAVWWVVLTLTWLLAAGLKWSSEAISKYSQVFHFIAWSIPTGLTALALLLTTVEGDPLSGLCTISTEHRLAHITFLSVPMLLFLTTGVTFLLIGFTALARLRGSIKHQSHQDAATWLKSERFRASMVRIGVFGLFYAVPNILVLCSTVYEFHHTRSWALGLACDCHFRADHVNQMDPILPTWIPPRVPYTLFLLKHSMTLSIGLTAGFWICSPKTWYTWRRVCCTICSGLSTKPTSHRFIGTSNRGGITRLLPGHIGPMTDQEVSSKVQLMTPTSWSRVLQQSVKESTLPVTSSRYNPPPGGLRLPTPIASVQYEVGVLDQVPSECSSWPWYGNAPMDVALPARLPSQTSITSLGQAPLNQGIVQTIPSSINATKSALKTSASIVTGSSTHWPNALNANGGPTWDSSLPSYPASLSTDLSDSIQPSWSELPGSRLESNRVGMDTQRNGGLIQKDAINSKLSNSTARTNSTNSSQLSSQPTMDGYYHTIYSGAQQKQQQQKQQKQQQSNGGASKIPFDGSRR